MSRKKKRPRQARTSRPETPSARAASPAASYAAEWPHPHYPGSRCGIHAGADGVTVWSSAGLDPHTELGRSYTWEEWFSKGGPGPGAPPGTLAHIDEVARQWGKVTPAPDPRPVARRADFD